MDALNDEFMAAEIFNRLDFASWARCKAVCRRWRKTLLGRTSPPNQIPWLCDIYLEDPHYEIIDISLNTMYTAALPPQMLANFPNGGYECAGSFGGYECAGSFGPWLILFKELQWNNKVKVCACLYNPLSSEHLTLPPFPWICGEYFFAQARLSCMPNQSNLSSSKCVVAAFTRDSIYMCKPNDSAWIKVFGRLDGTFVPQVTDVTFHFGCNGQLRLYFINCDGEMTAFDVTSKTCQNIMWDYEKVCSKRGAIFKLVVDFSGDLLVVGQNELRLDSGEESTWPSRVTVHKLWQGRLIGVDNLGGGMIFIGTDNNKNVSCYCTRAACIMPDDVPRYWKDYFVEDSVYYLDLRPLGDHDWEDVLKRFPVNLPSSFTLPEVRALYIEKSVSWFMPMVS